MNRSFTHTKGNICILDINDEGETMEYTGCRIIIEIA